MRQGLISKGTLGIPQILPRVAASNTIKLGAKRSTILAQGHYIFEITQHYRHTISGFYIYFVALARI